MSDRNTANRLDLAEIAYEDGGTHFRYSRYLAADRTRWIRHGLYRSYHRNGQVATEGEYQDGAETGVWRDFHENGVVAAQGEYSDGKEHGMWLFWSPAGQLEKQIEYVDGVPLEVDDQS